MTNTAKSTPIWEEIDKAIAAEADKALARYRDGEDEVNLVVGGLAIKLFDRKDNDDRETVRMTMDEFVNTVRACHVNGAALAASAIAEAVAQTTGLKVVDDEEV